MRWVLILMSESEHAAYEHTANAGQSTSNARLAILVLLGAVSYTHLRAHETDLLSRMPSSA